MQTTTRQVPPNSPDQIARAAYDLWEQAGRPAGRDQEFWFKAEQQLASAAKPTAVSIGQLRPKSSSDKATTAFTSTPPSQTVDTGRAASPAVTRLSAPRQKPTASAARAS